MGIGFKLAIALEQEGFEHYDYSVLAILAEGIPETQATIANTLNVDPSRLVAVLDSLEQRGCRPTARPAGPTAQVVSITADGKRDRRGCATDEEARERVLRTARRGSARFSGAAAAAGMPNPRCASAVEPPPAA
jgi:DNA-binding MarR family transcriptional regulator